MIAFKSQIYLDGLNVNISVSRYAPDEADARSDGFVVAVLDGTAEDGAAPTSRGAACSGPQ